MKPKPNNCEIDLWCKGGIYEMENCAYFKESENFVFLCKYRKGDYCQSKAAQANALALALKKVMGEK